MNPPSLIPESLDISAELLKEIPARIALRYFVLPLARENGKLKVLVPEELSGAVKDELRILLGKELELVPAPRSKIEPLLAKLYGVGADVIESLTEEKEKEPETFDVSAGGGSAFGGEVIDQDSQEATVTKLVNEFLQDALKRRASDIHIEPFEKTFRIRYRVDGLLVEARVSERIRYLAPALISRIKVMASLDIGERRLPQDGRIKIRQKKEEIDLRVSVLPSSYGEAIVIRILKPLELLSLDDLGFDEEARSTIRLLLEKPHGMMLVTGPTGSGKTTTLYACLKALNTIERKVITIEDPIEYKLHGILQMQVNPKIDFTFSKALRSMLRHDPDVMMVGEIRDQETAEISVRSALTGHLVLSTLHTNDASSAVTRLLEMGIEPYLVASSVEAVLAQRLVRKICPPCDRCQNSGYFGRTVVYEFMKVNESIRSLILQEKPASEIRKEALSNGMTGLLEDGRRKLRQNVTSLDELQRIISYEK